MKDDTPERKEQLLVAARNDAPPQGARDRALLAMGVAASASLAGAEAAAAKLKTAALKSTAAAPASGASLLLKAVGLGTVAGALGMATILGLKGQGTPPAREREAPGSVVPSATPVQRPAASREAASIPSVIVSPTPATSHTAAMPASALSAPGGTPVPTLAEPSSRPPSAAAPAIEAERALIETARQSLAAGRASTAIKALNEYEARFGFGVLGHEQVALKVKALLTLGRRSEAAVVGEHYLAERPNGTQAATVRRLLAGAAPTPSSAPE